MVPFLTSASLAVNHPTQMALVQSIKHPGTTISIRNTNADALKSKSKIVIGLIVFFSVQTLTLLLCHSEPSVLGIA
jgi:hypothetical protein